MANHVLRLNTEGSVALQTELPALVTTAFADGTTGQVALELNDAGDAVEEVPIEFCLVVNGQIGELANKKILRTVGA